MYTIVKLNDIIASKSYLFGFKEFNNMLLFPL